MNRFWPAAVIALGIYPFAARGQGPAVAQPSIGRDSTTEGVVGIDHKSIAYKAIAGTITVGATDVEDSRVGAESIMHSTVSGLNPSMDEEAKSAPVARMFYVAYFKKGERPESRPVTFLYNGGPGSASVWLHMGAFGPKRVVTLDAAHTPPAPYKTIDNTYSLLDASDLVFIDAPGTGFGELAGKDKEKAFWGADEDANAFARFIDRFLSQYGRWNSPKFLLGESYGTARSANLANILQMGHGIDLNGIIMLSQLLDYSNSAHVEIGYPGTSLPFVLSLPTYAASAFYYHKVGDPPPTLEALLHEVEEFALGPYAHALLLGSELPHEEKQEIAEKLHRYTGLPVAYILRSNLRISGGSFEAQLQADQNLTTGRLDTRFAGASMDSLSDRAQYDPQTAALGSAYAAAFNDYTRNVLKFGSGLSYVFDLDDDIRDFAWNPKHRTYGEERIYFNALNVMPDLGAAMKFNPQLKLMVNCGYYDLSTPFFAALYDIHHLDIPDGLRGNITYAFYAAGHMPYVREDALKRLHDNVARFIWSASPSQ